MVFALAAGALYGVNWYSKSKFIEAYNSYEALAALQQNAAFVPGAADNPVRDQLNTALSQVLAKETSASKRLQLSSQGVDLVKQLNAQADDIHTTGEPVAASITALSGSAGSIGNIYNRSVMTGLVTMAKAQQDTIQNIRALTYRSNFEILQIFNHILADKGALTDQYTIELNDDIPSVEAEFNQRQNGYLDLQKNMYDMSQAFGKLDGTK